MNCKSANLKWALKININIYLRLFNITYVYKNKIDFGKRPQTGKEVVSNVLPHLLQKVRDKIGI